MKLYIEKDKVKISESLSGNVLIIEAAVLDTDDCIYAARDIHILPTKSRDRFHVLCERNYDDVSAILEPKGITIG